MTEQEYLDKIEEIDAWIKSFGSEQIDISAIDPNRLNEIICLYNDAVKEENWSFRVFTRLVQFFGTLTIHSAILFALHNKIVKALLTICDFNRQHCGMCLDDSSDSVKEFKSRKLVSCEAKDILKLDEGNILRFTANAIKKIPDSVGFFLSPPNSVIETSDLLHNQSYVGNVNSTFLFLGEVEVEQNFPKSSTETNKYKVSKWLVTNDNVIVYARFSKKDMNYFRKDKS